MQSCGVSQYGYRRDFMFIRILILKHLEEFICKESVYVLMILYHTPSPSTL